MVADSPYGVLLQAMPTGYGAVCGGIGAGVMLAVAGSAAALGDGGPPPPFVVAYAICGAPAGPSAAGCWGTVLAGHGALGALLGVLYAVSQRRAATGALLGVGAFYGLFVWLVGRLVAAVALPDVHASAMSSWAWLAACLTFGLVLAGSAAVHQRRHMPPSMVAPLD
jgi:hypothetical protein